MDVIGFRLDVGVQIVRYERVNPVVQQLLRIKCEGLSQPYPTEISAAQIVLGGKRQVAQRWV